MASHYVGQRLSYNSSRCTVRHCGPIEGKEGDWLGVEWDDPEGRGTHDGTYRGKRYFKCIVDSSRVASFVRPNRPTDRTFTFLQALKAKYREDELNEAFLEDISISSTVVDEIGFERIRTQLRALQHLRTVVLDGSYVTGITRDEYTNIQSQRMRITDLDLSRNLLERWDQILGICSSLSGSLQTLTLDGNRISYLGLGESNFANSGIEFSGITELSLSSTYLSWQHVIERLRHFPLLRRLCLSSNGLGRLPGPLPASQLKTLDLSYNKITALSDIEQLTSHTGLERLSLRHNRLTSLATSNTFATITSLDLTATWLPDIASLDPIPRTFPALTALLTTNTPFAVTLSARQIAIARLPALKELNYAAIDAVERQQAEIDYMNIIGKDLKAATSVSEYNVVRAKHSLYEHLCHLHGKSPVPYEQPSTKHVPGPGTLAAEIIEFTFCMNKTALHEAQKAAPLQNYEPKNVTTNPESSEMDHLIEKQKRIPRSVDTYGLKGIVGRLFGIQPMACTLIWETGELDPAGGESDEGWSVSEDESDDSSGKDGDDGGRKDNNVNGDVVVGSIEGGQHRTLTETQTAGDGLLSQGPKGEGDGRRWQKREVEIVDGTRAVGNWVEAKEARIRVELRELV